MHPIEQLRYVARAGGADAGALVEEAAMGLLMFSRDPAAMLMACRRLLTRQPAVGPLWDLTARMVTAAEPRAAAAEVVDNRRSDRCGHSLISALPDDSTVAFAGWPGTVVQVLPRRGDLRVLVADVEGQGAAVERYLGRSEMNVEAVDPARLAGIVAESELVIVEPGALGPEKALVDTGVAALAAVAHAYGTAVWMVVPAGCRILGPYWAAVEDRVFGAGKAGFWASHEILDLALVDRFVVGAEVVDTDAVPDLSQPLATELL